MRANESSCRDAHRRGVYFFAALIAAGLFFGFTIAAHSAELSSARQEFIAGHYTNCAALCEQAIAEREYEEEWRVLIVKSLFASGQYEQAGTILSNALDRYSWSIPMRLLAHEVLPYVGDTNGAAESLQQIASMVASRREFRVRDTATFVAIGKAALLMGEDPRRVLDNIFEQARKLDPNSREVYLATGELALDKHDFKLAAKHFNAGLKKFPDDPTCTSAWRARFNRAIASKCCNTPAPRWKKTPITSVRC